MKVFLDGRDVSSLIRTPALTNNVKYIACIPGVRHEMVKLQRAIGRRHGSVLEGRDIGTVVFPDAEVKVFLVADAGQRARRRLLERGATPDAGALRSESDALVARDARDAGRDVAPLRPAADAVPLDTSGLSFGEQVRRVVALVRERWDSPSLDRPGGAG